MPFSSPGDAADAQGFLKVMAWRCITCWKHTNTLKAIALGGKSVDLAAKLALQAIEGLCCRGKDAKKPLTPDFFAAIANQRVWAREEKAKAMPA